MGIIVQKFGGTSVADTDKLFIVCQHIINEYEKGNKVVVVVSAQGKMTDRLIKEEKEITLNPDEREHDVLLSTGEQITISKLSMCLIEKGYDAISLTGWQIPIITDDTHTDAKIKFIQKDRILKYLKENKIVIVAGFQGINQNGDITTLGRGGSDTTAVALASSLEAERCDIYTDVDGIFSTDPRLISNVSKIDDISYDEMLELSSLGAKVLHNRCVEIGKKYHIPIQVKSTFAQDSIGTSLIDESEIEKPSITGITKQEHITRITVVGKTNEYGRLYKIINLLAKNNIKVDMIVQSLGEHILKNVSFSIYDCDLEAVLKILDYSSSELKIKKVLHYKNLSKISIVGIGIFNNPKISAEMFRILYDKKIHVHMISTSEIKISILVNEKEADLALRALHKGLISNS